MGVQHEINSPGKPVQPGKRMRSAWSYIAAHPWCSESLIRINYGQSTLDRLVRANMIETRAGKHDRELKALHDWYQGKDTDLDTESLLKKAIDRIQSSKSIGSIPCPICHASPGQMCRALKTRLPCKHHPQRVTLWTYKILNRYGELDH